MRAATSKLYIVMAWARADSAGKELPGSAGEHGLLRKVRRSVPHGFLEVCPSGVWSRQLYIYLIKFLLVELRSFYLWSSEATKWVGILTGTYMYISYIRHMWPGNAHHSIVQQSPRAGARGFAGRPCGWPRPRNCPSSAVRLFTSRTRAIGQSVGCVFI
jgi:hypothetical protein